MNCVLAGNGSLLIACGDILEARGHAIGAVISEDRSILEWAEAHGTPGFGTFESFLGSDRSEDFDFFLSIANLRIVGREILSRAKRAAINYHDGPLPRYAGLRATSWALINGETEHGIAWHCMTDGIDEGDVLKLSRVPIEPDDDAYSLNLSCYGAAIESFEELVAELERGGEARTVQSLQERTYHGRLERPVTLIDWALPAATTANLARGLAFGPHPNPLGVPKSWLGRSVVLLPRVEVCGARSGAAPGTIVEAGPSGVRVATSTSDVLLPEILSFCGTPLPLGDLVHDGRLRVGDSMAWPADRDPAEAHRRLLAVVPSERRWVRRLERMASASSRGRLGTMPAPPRTSLPCLLPDATRERVDALPPDVRLALLAAGVGVAGAGFDVARSLSVGVSTGTLAAAAASMPGLLCDVLPVLGSSGDVFADALDVCTEARDAGSTFAWDLLCRYPGLRPLIERVEFGWLDVFVADHDGFDRCPPLWRAPVGLVHVDAATHWSFAADGHVETFVRELQRRLPGALHDLLESVHPGARSSLRGAS
jgi:polyketide synthase PksN